MRKKKLFITLIISGILLTCTGCKVSNVNIAVTVYPVQYLMERIGGNNVQVENISEEGAIQTARVKKGMEKTLEDSSALFYLAELEPYFDVYSSNLRTNKLKLVDLAKRSVFYKFQRYTTTSAEGQNAVIESTYYEGDVFKSIDIYKDDPIIWMDPIAMISAAEIVRDYLVENYPEYKAAFEDNYKKLEMDLTRLDRDYQILRKADKSISFVSMTPSFGAWQKAYGISLYPICLSKFGALPSTEQLAVIKQRIIDDGVEYIAHEPNLNPEMKKLYKQLQEEFGLTEIELSNVSSLSEKQREENKDYLTIMYENLSILEKIGNNEI